MQQLVCNTAIINAQNVFIEAIRLHLFPVTVFLSLVL